MSSQLLQSEYINRHPYFTARRDRYQLPSGKIVDPYFVVELPVSATAMAVTSDNKVILVEQYRHPVGETLLELPGGFVDDNELPETAIRRELMEETGYTFDKVVSLGVTAANPGVLSNFTHLFLATGGMKAGEQSLDHNEEIRIVLEPLGQVRDLLFNSRIKQSMHALCLFYGFKYLGDL